MALDLGFLADDFDAIRSDISQTATFQGVDFRCVAGQEDEGNDLADIGFEGGSTIDIHVEIDDLNDLGVRLPKTGDVLHHNATSWRVESFTDDAAGVVRVLRCRSANT